MTPEQFLPAISRDRLEQIRAKATGERAIKLDLSAAQRDYVIEKQRLMAEADRLDRWKIGRTADSATERELTKVQAALAEAQARLDGTNQRIAALPQATIALSGRLERFAKALRAPVAAGPVVKLAQRKGESLVDMVARLRAELAELKADRREVEAAPRTASETKVAIAEQIDELARQGEPDVLGCIEAGIPVTWPRIVTDPRTSPAAGGLHGSVHLLCWLARDLLVERLCASVDELADDSHSLDVATRGYRLAKITEKTLMTERQEAEAIWAALAAGITIEFRADADVRAVLALADNVVEA
jgi:hypothetical protein